MGYGFVSIHESCKNGLQSSWIALNNGILEYNG